MLNLFVLCVVLFGILTKPLSASLDPPPPLRGVEIVLKSGRSIEGYITSTNLDTNGKIVSTRYFDGDIRFYPDLREFKWPSIETVHSSYMSPPTKKIEDKALFVSVGKPLMVKLDSILSYELKPGPFENRGRYIMWTIPEKAASLFESPPFGYVNCDNDGNGFNWISYNKRVRSDDLTFLCKEPWALIIFPNKDLEKKRIFGFQHEYD